ncbi:MAG: hypothetical protein HYW37_01130 [Candidatus Colwellbacteria bacterium]|nr:hypothetical protein [Candidatus Colwellbacteria bacterium]
MKIRTKKMISKIALVLALLLVVLLYFYKDSLFKFVSPYINSKSPVAGEVIGSNPAAPKEPPDTGYNKVATIAYDGATLSPQNVSFTFKPEEIKSDNVKSGQWIKIINKSSQLIRVYSDPPSGDGSNEELNAGLISPGEFKIMRITKKGTWKYAAGVAIGTIVVK